MVRICEHAYIISSLSAKSKQLTTVSKKAAAIATALSFLFILSVSREALPFSQVYEIVVDTATL